MAYYRRWWPSIFCRWLINYLSLLMIRCNSLVFFYILRLTVAHLIYVYWIQFVHVLFVCNPSYPLSAWAPEPQRSLRRNFWDGPWHALGRPQLTLIFVCFTLSGPPTRAAALQDFEVLSGSFTSNGWLLRWSTFSTFIDRATLIVLRHFSDDRSRS